MESKGKGVGDRRNGALGAEGVGEGRAGTELTERTEGGEAYTDERKRKGKEGKLRGAISVLIIDVCHCTTIVCAQHLLFVITICIILHSSILYYNIGSILLFAGM